ncbi:MAG: hypothetical protein AAFX93_07965 [Verrucomicrobiota bacterium]
MRNPHWFRKTVFPEIANNDHIMEFGAGFGDIANDLVSYAPCQPTHYRAIDLSPPPADFPTQFAWQQIDCMSIKDFGTTSVFFGNLIIHQFDNIQLKTLGQRINESQIRLIALQEPERCKRSEWLFKFLYPIVNDVSRHDGNVSIRAGFKNDELAQIFGLNESWRYTVETSFFGSYRFLATRDAPSPS